jgi:hypothetical protein
MRYRLPLIVLAAAGCGVQEPPDHTEMFIRCLQESGGQRISAPAQLDVLPSTDVQLAVGASLDSVSYYALDVATDAADRRRALVFVEGLHDHYTPNPMPEPPTLLAAARHGTTGVLALVLMPPSSDTEAPVGRCEERAAPGQSVP